MTVRGVHRIEGLQLAVCDKNHTGETLKIGFSTDSSLSDLMDSIKRLLHQAEITRSPLVLDLNGDSGKEAYLWLIKQHQIFLIFTTSLRSENRKSSYQFWAGAVTHAWSETAVVHPQCIIAGRIDEAVPYSARACTFLSLPADNLRERIVCEVSHYVCLRTV